MPWHAWPVVASSGSAIGHRGMIYAAATLAATLVDLFADPGHLAELRRDSEDKTAGHVDQPCCRGGATPLPEN